MKNILLVLIAMSLASCNQPKTKSPHTFPKSWNTSGQKIFVFDPQAYGWAVYNEQGYKIKSGTASGGKKYCPDLKKPCRTVTGSFQVISKKGADCKSSQFPINKNGQGSGGAKMPYCMHFYKGYAIHGAQHMSREHVSHGCIHVSVQDAKWLNEEFIDIGTAIIVRPYA